VTDPLQVLAWRLASTQPGFKNSNFNDSHRLKAFGAHFMYSSCIPFKLLIGAGQS
jgi:hypothetical protein